MVLRAYNPSTQKAEADYKFEARDLSKQHHSVFEDYHLSYPSWYLKFSDKESNLFYK